MLTRIATASLVLVLAFALIGCTAKPEPSPPVDQPVTSGDAAGMRLANGLYDLADGTAQAIGTLAYKDLEGGFWAIVGAPGADPNGVIVVLANGDDLEGTLKPLEGKTVVATGARAEGVSIRNAGPEMDVTKIEEITDTPGAAE